MYGWIVFLHVAGVFGFLLYHGVSMFVTLQILRERDPKRVAHLIELSGSSLKAFYISFFLLVGAGVWAGFMGQWWGRGWIWTSLALFIVTSALMGAIARPYFQKVGTAARASDATAESLQSVISKQVPVVLTVLGFGSLIVILYLMLFKPF
jgi:uncharacterized membrane protein